jgi:hypothetical protein
MLGEVCFEKIMAKIVDITHEASRDGVYLIFWEGELQYVGESSKVSIRILVTEYKGPRDKVWFVPCPGNRKKVEEHFIHDLRPRHNKAKNRPRNGFTRRAPPLKVEAVRHYLDKFDIDRISSDKERKPSLVQLGIRKSDVASIDLVKTLGLRTILPAQERVRRL